MIELLFRCSQHLKFYLLSSCAQVASDACVRLCALRGVRAVMRSRRVSKKTLNENEKSVEEEHNMITHLTHSLTVVENFVKTHPCNLTLWDPTERLQCNYSKQIKQKTTTAKFKSLSLGFPDTADTNSSCWLILLPCNPQATDSLVTPKATKTGLIA